MDAQPLILTCNMPATQCYLYTKDKLTGEGVSGVSS